ncbi:MAG: hypothetical protein HZA29_01095 [Candidatus Omnitrophica bacterium]|nr:hypothetical protein [Candidatus Omnitrophota bacterium]
MDSVISKNKIHIRLTDERWAHITEEHCELAGLRLEVMETVNDPSQIFAGSLGELIALREMAKGKYLSVIYREWARDGFIITAFLTKRVKSLSRRKLIWSR